MACSPSFAMCNGFSSSAFFNARCMKITSLSLSSTKRMGPFLLLMRFGKLNPKFAASARSGFDADPAAHPFHGFADDRESHPGALILFRSRRFFKHFKNSFPISWRDSDAIIFKPEPNLSIDGLGADFHHRFPPFRHKL